MLQSYDNRLITKRILYWSKRGGMTVMNGFNSKIDLKIIYFPTYIGNLSVATVF